ncbi:uncharacterized protein YALI1_F16376g [Yarrowia lipolytica]|uniref:Uncharacterized protein n=1 Tax=Yarrowia lipolytica TaxID=4952 RepID=A0A1D8NN75_YARLL|nr:hypothetical protein YALI1_F16376g [Yarrowia lipolytica]
MSEHGQPVACISPEGSRSTASLVLMLTKQTPWRLESESLGLVITRRVTAGGVEHRVDVRLLLKKEEKRNGEVYVGHATKCVVSSGFSVVSGVLFF